jgi:hypothetical protein
MVRGLLLAIALLRVTRREAAVPTGDKMHRYLWLGLTAISLSGCGPTLSERNWADAQKQCQLRTAKEQQQETYDDCVKVAFRNYEILSRYTPPLAQAPIPTYHPQAAAAPPSSDTPPPAPNIIPPTVRCQSVPAGLGTVQTVCR